MGYVKENEFVSIDELVKISNSQKIGRVKRIIVWVLGELMNENVKCHKCHTQMYCGRDYINFHGAYCPDCRKTSNLFARDVKKELKKI